MSFAPKSSEIHLVLPTGRAAAASHVFQRRRMSPATPSRVYSPLFPPVRPSVSVRLGLHLFSDLPFNPL